MARLKRYSGAVVDEVTGINPNTRRAWAMRGLLDGGEDGYTFHALLRAAVGMELARHGITNKDTRDVLLKTIVGDMLAQLEARDDTPRFVVAFPSAEFGDDSVAMGMIARGAYGFAGGDGALWIARGVTLTELTQHIAESAQAGGVAGFWLDTTGLLRRVFRKLGEIEGGQTP